MMLSIATGLQLPLEEVELVPTLSRGSGGQNVNKVATAIQLRFDVQRSSLPEGLKQRLLSCHDRRLTRDGIVIIRADRFRTSERNRADALKRLRELIAHFVRPPRPRKATRPTRAAQDRRLSGKSRRGQVKSLRRRVED